MELLSTTKGKIIASVIGIVLLVLLFWLIIWLSIHALWPTVRDIALILLALVSIIPVLALSYAVFQIGRTIKLLRQELAPLLEDLKETTRTVRDTAKIASEYTIKPTVKTAGTMIGVAQFLSVILGGGKTRKRANEARRKRAANVKKDTAGDAAEQITQDIQMGDTLHGVRK